MNKEKQAYKDAFWRLAAAYVELAQEVGCVNASDFFRHVEQEWTIPSAKNKGGRPRTLVDPEKRNAYNAPDNKGRKKRVGGTDSRRIQRRNQEEHDRAAARARLVTAGRRQLFQLSLEAGRLGATPEGIADFLRTLQHQHRNDREQLADRVSRDKTLSSRILARVEGAVGSLVAGHVRSRPGPKRAPV